MQPRHRHPLRYLQHYPVSLQQQVIELARQQRLGEYLAQRYPNRHEIRSDKALYHYVDTLRQQYLQRSQPLDQVCYDSKLDILKNALGTHTRQSQVQGKRLKRRQSIQIAALFKQAPAAMLEMIVVHELAHLKELEHNRAFYQLCQHMLPNYHQIEFDLRVYLLQQALEADPEQLAGLELQTP